MFGSERGLEQKEVISGPLHSRRDAGVGFHLLTLMAVRGKVSSGMRLLG